jgi:hypothetical protein
LLPLKTAPALFSKYSWKTESSLNATFGAIQPVVPDSSTVLSCNIVVTKNGRGSSSVNPAWLNTCLHAIQGAFWSDAATQSEVQAGSK